MRDFMSTMPSRKKSAHRKLQHANQAEILRSYQRDNDFIEHLSKKLSDILHKFQGQKFLHTLKSDLSYKLLYFLFTSGMGNQTLGEEYTGIVQAKFEAHKVPSLSARILAALLECFGERTLLQLIERAEMYVKSSPNRRLTQEDIARTSLCFSRLRIMIPIVILIHKGLFYMYGRYYSLSRRIVGIDYAKVYGNHSSDGVSWGLRILGLATLIQSVLKIWQFQAMDESNETLAIAEATGSNGLCRLCFEALSTTATPCGHLFCWDCINDWLHTKLQCPLCREHVTPSRIVLLMNL